MGNYKTSRSSCNFQKIILITLEEAYYGTTRIVHNKGIPDFLVKIPPGVKAGWRIRVRKKDNQNVDGQIGDLYLAIEIMPHAIYERKGDDLYCNVYIDMLMAMTGGNIRVDTFAGPIVIKVPQGISSGSTIRVRGRGMPKFNKPGEYGHLYLRVVVTNLT
ncbi:MAG: HSP40/DnaJ peptide-binding protein [Methylacidiphilales bacterium]|nr:HSP40/DnaJ peptide-binding protein [Candidatus Methylacidiphilales bacterium]